MARQLVDEYKKNLPDFVQIDDENAIVEKITQMFPYAIRDNPHCTCDDSECSYKQEISPLFLWSTGSQLHSHVNYKDNFIKIFKPSDYPLKIYDSYDQFNENTISSKLFYNRAIISNLKSLYKISNNTIRVSRATDTLEGFKFKEKPNSCKLMINGIDIILPIKTINAINECCNDEYSYYVLLDNVFILTEQHLCYTDIIFTFDFGEVNLEDIHCAAIVGYFYLYPTCDYKFKLNDKYSIVGNYKNRMTIGIPTDEIPISYR